MNQTEMHDAVDCKKMITTIKSVAAHLAARIFVKGNSSLRVTVQLHLIVLSAWKFIIPTPWV
jgi:hypothetical protein